MAFKVYDRVKETSSTAGSGTITLAGAVNGFQAFGDVYSNGDTTHYVIVNASKWETGLGTYSSGTLSRDTVFESSNNDQLVTLAGASTVFVSYPAARTVLAESSSFGHSGVPYVNASGHLNDNAGLVYDYTNQNLNVGGNITAQSGVLNVVDFNPISAISALLFIMMNQKLACRLVKNHTFVSKTIVALQLQTAKRLELPERKGHIQQ
jgi:hypothetical protein